MFDIVSDSLEIAATGNNFPLAQETFSLEEWLKNQSSYGLATYVFPILLGSYKIAEIIPPLLQKESLKKTSSVNKFTLYCLMAASLYYETMDGQLPQERALGFVVKINEMMDYADDGRQPYTKFLFEDYPQINPAAKKIIRDMPENLKDSLLHRNNRGCILDLLKATH